MKKILILKQDSRYQTTEYLVDFANVLKINFINQSKLKNLLSTFCQYGAVVITSQSVLHAIADLNLKIDSSWFKIKTFVVGKQTASLCKTFGLDAVGESTGSSESLTNYIIKEYKDIRKPIIFFVGDKTKQDMPLKLERNGISIVQMQVYYTTRIPLNIEQEYDFIVAFSPSGIDSVCNLFSFKNTVWVAIGKTTLEKLKTLGLNSIVCLEPSPEGVFDCIKNYQE